MQRLHDLVNDPSALRRALERGADPNARDAAGDTAIHASVWRAPVDTVQALLAAGADVDARNKRGISVFQEAVRRDRYDMALVLAKSGATVTDSSEEDGSTALHWAARAGRADFVRFLLARDARIDATDKTGRTAVDWVLTRDDGKGALREVLHLLLSRGAAHTPETAVAKGRREHVQAWLGRGMSPRQRMSDRGSALGLAAAEGEESVVRVLLDAGARPDGERFDTNSPLLRAVKARRPEVVETLLAARANPEHGGSKGGAPLDALADIQYPDAAVDRCADLLLAHGARPTPHWAAAKDDPELLDAALRAGWPINRAATGGVTALMLAARREAPRITAALLARGADWGLVDDSRATALHIAVDGLHGSDGRASVVELLLAAGADPNARDHLGQTALHVALRLLHTYGVDIAVVTLLAKHGVDPFKRDASGQTAVEMDAGMNLHHDVRGDPGQTVARRDAAVATVKAILRGRRAE